MNKLIAIAIALFVAMSSSVNADEDLDTQIAAQCAATQNTTEQEFCERVKTIKLDYAECALEEIECDQQYLKDLLGLYWAVRFAEMGGLLK
jgi:hypothetical protein